MANWSSRGDLSVSSTTAVVGYVAQWIDGALTQLRSKNQAAATEALEGAMHDVTVLANRMRKTDDWWNKRSRWKRAIDAWAGRRPDWRW
jgi:hypothetical protein